MFVRRATLENPLADDTPKFIHLADTLISDASLRADEVPFLTKSLVACCIVVAIV